MGDDEAAMNIDEKFKRANSFTSRIAEELGLEMEGYFIRIGIQDGVGVFVRAYVDPRGYSILEQRTGRLDKFTGEFQQTTIVENFEEAVDLVRAIKRGLFTESL